MFDVWWITTLIVAACALIVAAFLGMVIDPEKKSEGEARAQLGAWMLFLFSWTWIVTFPIALVILFVFAFWSSLKGTVEAANVPRWRR